MRQNESVKTFKSVINKNCSCLPRYKLFMSAYISDRLPEAHRGGVPSAFNLVGSFVALNFNNQSGSIIGLQDGLVDGKPLWPMVYFSLRCGNIQSALKCLQQAGCV